MMASRWLVSASDAYDQITFLTDDIFNEKAPEPWIAFLIGGICAVTGFAMWIRRLRLLRSIIGPKIFKGSVLFRAMISAAIDSDEPFYTISSFSAFSFVSLGGLQLDYELTLAVMLAIFAVASLGDSIRVLVAYHDASSLAEVVVTSNLLASKLAKNSKRKITVTTELSPSNVYEDLGRGTTIVLMVFMTQTILIAFVAADIYQNNTHSCPDGTRNCPVVGTLGSWGFYVLGIFMACVYLLGPKTNFGQSEQNPAYWLQLLLAAKQSGAKCSWFDAVADKEKERQLSRSDWRIWGRFFMSFIVNGIGFHILVHALPIQVAQQNSFLGVVFRAVGMLYLVDLDDTPAEYRFLLTTKVDEEHKALEKAEEVIPLTNATSNNDTMPSMKPPMAHPIIERPTTTLMSEAEFSEAAQRIITEALEDARVKMEALARGENVLGGVTLPSNSKMSSSQLRKASSRKLMSGALITASNPAKTAAALESIGALEGMEDVEGSGEDAGMENGGQQGTIAVDNGTTDAPPFTAIKDEIDVEEQEVSDVPIAPPEVDLDPPPMPSIAEVPSDAPHVTFADEQQQEAPTQAKADAVEEEQKQQSQEVAQQQPTPPE